jgi:hypothetical protein
VVSPFKWKRHGAEWRLYRDRRVVGRVVPDASGPVCGGCSSLEDFRKWSAPPVPLMTAGNSPSRSLVKADASDVPATLGHELEEAAGYARVEKAPATRRAYRSIFRAVPLYGNAVAHYRNGHGTAITGDRCHLCRRHLNNTDPGSFSYRLRPVWDLNSFISARCNAVG